MKMEPLWGNGKRFPHFPALYYRGFSTLGLLKPLADPAHNAAFAFWLVNTWGTSHV